jgi:hypothetical protein
VSNDNKKREKRVNVGFQLGLSQLEKAKRFAEKKDVPVSHVYRKAVHDFLSKIV